MAKRRATAKESPFGETSRVELLDQHFRAFGPITPSNAWKFVYEELLWFDRSKGLAHLYESDKVRPGRSAWYKRSIVYTDRLAELYGVDRAGLRKRIDRLFLGCLERLVESQAAAHEQAQTVMAAAEEGEAIGLPQAAVQDAKESAETVKEEADVVPHAELLAEVTDMLMARAGLGHKAAISLARDIVSRAQYHFTFGSNRQNVLGEGFEDVLKLLMVRVAGVPEDKIAVRRKADELPGFQGRLEGRRRVEKPDMAIIERGKTQHIATVKWSLRHDRQKQLTDELDCYVQLCTQSRFPEYVLVTNEYDPGRLKNSSNLSSRGKTVDRIYHINPDLLVEVLSDVPASVAEVRALLDADRLRSLANFLTDLAARFAPRRK
jgi:hypothetical protein